MPLTSTQHETLVNAICETFSGPEFIEFVRHRLDTTLGLHVADGLPFRKMAFDFIGHCDRRGQIDVLLTLLIAERPHEPRFAALAIGSGGPVANRQFGRLRRLISRSTYIWVAGLVGITAAVAYKAYPALNPPVPQPWTSPSQPPAVIRKTPDQVAVTSVELYGAKSHGRWLDCIKDHLQDEGLEEKRVGAISDFRVVRVITKPWDHATPAFDVHVSPVLGVGYKLSGIGFRVTKAGPSYQPLLARRDAERWTFSVAECDIGDTLLFLLRISTDPSTPFPGNTRLSSLFEVTPK